MNIITESPTKVMEDIPEIPSRGLPWKKVYGLIGLTGVGIGTAIGTGTWGGVENGNKNAVWVQKVSLENQKTSLEAQTQELQAKVVEKDAEIQKKSQEFENKKEDFKKQAKFNAIQELYRSGELGLEKREQDIMEAFRNPNGWNFGGRRLTIKHPRIVETPRRRR